MDQRATPSTLPRAALATIIYSRTVINLDFRIVYPFLPAIARGLGISLEAAGQMVAIQGGASLLAPLFGHLSDRYGRRRVMELGLLLLGLAAWLVASMATYAPALLAFAGFGIAKGLFDPAMQAYVADIVPYDRRGRVIGLTELAWSFAWLFGVPLSGLLIEGVGWQGPWWMILVLSVVGIVATRLFLPPARREHHPTDKAPTSSWTALFRQSTVRAILVVGFTMMFAVENIFIVYGAFLENSFGLAIGAIGLVSTVIGVAELAGEGGAATLTDRIGKRRSVILGLLLFGASLLALPFLSGSLVSVLAIFSLAIFFFEYTIVSFIPLVSEAAPTARATLLALNVGVLGAGRLVAPLIGTVLYERTDTLLYNSLLSALLCLISALVMWRWVREL